MSKRSAEQEPDRRLEIGGSYSGLEPVSEPAVEDELQRAERLVIEGELAGIDELELGMRLGDMARVCFARQAYAEAIPPLTRLLGLSRAQGEDRPEVATVLSSLAAAHYALGELNQAAQLWDEALQIRERRLVPNHFMIARSVENLADVREAQGRMGEALTLLRRALSIWQQTLSPDDPTLRAIRGKIGDLQLLSSQELPTRGAAAAPYVPTPFQPQSPPRVGSYTPEPTRVERAPSPAPESFDLPRDPGPSHSSADPPARASLPNVPEILLVPLMGDPQAASRPPLPGDPGYVRPVRDGWPEISESDTVSLWQPPVASAEEAPVDVEPPVALADVPMQAPFLVALDERPAEEPIPVETDADRKDRPAARNWVQVGRQLAQTPQETGVKYHSLPVEPPEAAPPAHRHPRATRVAPPIVLALVLFGLYRLVGSETPPAGASASMVGAPVGAAARTPPSVVRTTSAGTVAPAASRNVATPPRAVARENSSSNDESARSAGAASATKSRNAPTESGTTAAANPVSDAASTRLADAMKAVEVGTVSGADSAVRRMMYGGALALDANRVAPAPAATASAASVHRAAPEEATDMKPAMLAPGGEQPVFPFQLLSENVTGSVVVEVLVGADGRPDAKSARVVRSSHPLFTASVMRALPTMRFVPAEAHGQKVAQRIEVPFRFDRKVAGQ